MPTAFVKKIADKNGVSVSDAEAKWEEAKKSVDKSKYSDNRFLLCRGYKNLQIKNA